MEQQRKDANVRIGKRLREARSNLGRTRAEMAVSCGVSEEIGRAHV